MIKHNNKGAASVLVIVMMLVLVIFGLAMVTTALAQYRLSQNHESFLADYYALETQAQKQINHMDQLFYQSEMDSLEFIKALVSLEITYTGPLSDFEIYGDAYEQLEGTPSKSRFLLEVFPVIYKDHVVHYLEIYSLSQERISYTVVPKITGLDQIVVDFMVISEDEQYQKFMAVQLEVVYPMYALAFEEDAVAFNKEASLNHRFLVNQYEQGQISFEYEESIKFSDPFEKPK